MFEDISLLKKSLSDLGEEIRGNRKAVLEAVRNSPAELKYATEELKSDKEFVTEVIRENAESVKNSSWGCLLWSSFEYAD